MLMATRVGTLRLGQHAVVDLQHEERAREVQHVDSRPLNSATPMKAWRQAASAADSSERGFCREFRHVQTIWSK